MTEDNDPNAYDNATSEEKAAFDRAVVAAYLVLVNANRDQRVVLAGAALVFGQAVVDMGKEEPGLGAAMRIAVEAIECARMVRAREAGERAAAQVEHIFKGTTQGG